MFVSLLAMAGFHFFLPVRKIIVFPYSLAGLLPVAAGIWLNLRADGMFSKNRTTVKPFEAPACFIVEGPFRFTRNPMYFGMVLILAGIAVFSGAITVFTVPAAYLILMDVIFIKEEERSMAGIFGARYEEYRKKVRKWI